MGKKIRKLDDSNEELHTIHNNNNNDSGNTNKSNEGVRRKEKKLDCEKESNTKVQNNITNNDDNNNNNYQANIEKLKKYLENSSILAVIDCTLIIFEFTLFMILFSISNLIITQIQFSQQINNIFEMYQMNQSIISCICIAIIKLIEWSITPVLVILWFFYHHEDRIQRPPKQISSSFGLKLKFTLPSKTLLIISMIIILEFIISINFELFTHPEYHSYVDTLNFDLYFTNNETKLNFIHEMNDIHHYHHNNNMNGDYYLYFHYFYQIFLLLQKYCFHLNSEIQFQTLYNLIFITPFLEEFIFRGLLITTFIMRTKQVNWKSYFIPSLLFGLFHLINLPSSRYSTAYIFLQVLAGLLVGSFYSIHFIQKGRLWECITLHMLNNFLCSFLPRYTSATDLLNINVIFQIVGTVICSYCLLPLVEPKQEKKRD